MMRNLQVIALFSVLALVSFLVFPVVGVTRCDYGKTLISLQVIDKSISNIIKDIEKQTGYTIFYDKEKAPSSIISINFDKTPLSTTFNRLFKATNYSIVCDDNKKELSIVFLQKTGGNLARNYATQEVDPLAGLAESFNDPQKVIVSPQKQISPELQNIVDDGPLGGLAESFNDSQEVIVNPEKQISPELQNIVDDGPLGGLAESFNDSQEVLVNPQKQTSPKLQSVVDNGPLAGLSQFFTEIKGEK